MSKAAAIPKSPFRVLALLLAVFAARAQQSPKDFTDPVALLKAVARTYAAGVDTFRMQSIEEKTSNADLRHEWERIYETAIKGNGNLYRIESRSAYGSFIQVSDGTTEWVYQVEGKMYVKRPLPQDWPQFSRLYFAGNMYAIQAWSMRMSLESLAAGYKQATMLAPETIAIDGHTYSCYVVHVTSNDSTGRLDQSLYSDTTLWIDKAALVFRKQVRHSSTCMTDSGNSAIRLPYLEDTATVYPAAEFNVQFAPDTFTFTPPSDAKLVAKLEDDRYVPTAPTPRATMAGQAAPGVSFTAADGSKVALASYRGKPLLLDLWATWCGPCLASLPALNRIYMDARNMGVAVVTVDQDSAAEDATEYLARHDYSWTNYHDAGFKISTAFKDVGIPLTILIDGRGKIVYYATGGDETAVRQAIAALGPEFASIAAPASSNSSPPSH
jgi:thiol-disulfide isomerase/thioredoxin